MIKKPQPKRRKNKRKIKFWEKLKGTYADPDKGPYPREVKVENLDINHVKLQANVERLIAAVQQDLMWDDTDIETYHKIQSGYVDWSGQVHKPKAKQKKKKK